MRIVDTKGQKCPAPLIATKRALKETAEGETFMVLTDNQTSFNNLSRFLKDNNVDFRVSAERDIWTFTVTKTKIDLSQVRTEDYCSVPIAHFEKGNFIIVFTSDKMGDGDDELGHLLINNFVKAIKDLDCLPQKMLFYNKGVRLVTKSSPVIEHLMDLEKMGVELILCATCVNYYSLDASIATGTLSNMYTIAEVMASAGHIIRP